MKAYTIESRDGTNRGEDSVHAVCTTLELAQSRAAEAHNQGYEDEATQLNWTQVSLNTWTAEPRDSDISWLITEFELVTA